LDEVISPSQSPLPTQKNTTEKDETQKNTTEKDEDKHPCLKGGFEPTFSVSKQSWSTPHIARPLGISVHPTILNFIECYFTYFGDKISDRCTESYDLPNTCLVQSFRLIKTLTTNTFLRLHTKCLTSVTILLYRQIASLIL
jgi:hypothetical protein